MKADQIKQIEQLIKIFDKSTLLELRYEEGETEIYLSRKGETGQVGQAGSIAVTVPTVPVVPAVQEEELETYITSPIVSTFYPTPSPDAKPFVNVGDRVKIGQVVCILEAMKIMTEIKCEFECEIEAVLVSSGQKVEYGQPLFRVKRI